MSSKPPPESAPREPLSTVFVSDPSAEAEKIAQTLRAAGYVVVDVPMSMLIARVAVQRPRVILVDADAEGALDAIGRLRELPDAEGIDVVFLGKEGVVLAGPEDALAHEGSGFFARPVDVSALVRKIEALTGGPPDEDMPRASTPPPSLPSQRLANLPPPSMRAAPDHISSRPPGRPPSRPPPAAGASLSPQTVPESAASPSMHETSRRAVSIQTPLSHELEALLAEAEQRVGLQAAPEIAPPTPEEEIEAVLPAEILLSLDEPIDEEDDDDLEVARGGPDEDGGEPGDPAQAQTHGGPHGAPTTGTRAGPSIIDTGRRSEAGPTGMPTGTRDTGGGSGAPTTGDAGALSGVSGPPTDYGDASRGQYTAPNLMSSTLGSTQPVASTSSLQALVGQADAPRPNDHSRKAQSVPPPPQVPSVLGPRDGPLVLARAIALRATGALCIEAADGVRRAVLREGDLVTAASGVDSESLLAFLGARGDLPREVVQGLAGKVPPFGRHAGAALVAHGHLRQDQLWNVLRAHAEWVLGRAILVPRGTALLEAEPPGRLRGEPSVFGGLTGSEVLVEVVRRVVAPSEAVDRMGGPGARLGAGENESLLSECALDAEERDLVGRMRGSTVGEAVDTAAGPDFASVLYALALLGVLDVVQSVGARPPMRPEAAAAAPLDALDEEAMRERVRARIQLVEEGDYFAVLGLSPDATGYEVRRAFLELRRAFEPTRLLTPRIADLADDVRKIASVLEEAYEILHDNVRRERYRRAIVGTPRAS